MRLIDADELLYALDEMYFLDDRTYERMRRLVNSMLTENVDRCSCCGEYVPEGRHVCYKCEIKNSHNSHT